MSTILSTIPEIRALRFEPIPTKAKVVTKVASTGHTVVLYDGKTIYTNRIAKNCAYLSDPSYFEEVWSCLKKLGVVSAEVIGKHEKAVADKRKKVDEYYAADSFLRQAGILGVKVEPELRKKLEKIVKDKSSIW